MLERAVVLMWSFIIREENFCTFLFWGNINGLDLSHQI